MEGLADKIKQIHNSSNLGIIVECGTGSVISNALYSYPFASKTIYESKQPYNKEVQNKYYGNSHRSVSWQFIKQVLEVELNNLPPSGRFVLVTSFQVSDLNPSILTHGWIGIASTSGLQCYYHFTLPFNTHRNNYLNEIKNIGINLLHSFLFMKEFYCSYNDMVYNTQGQLIPSTLSTALMDDDGMDNFVVSTPNGLVRFEDLVRDKKGIILQKGTYNPIHEGHLDIMKSSQKEYPEYPSAFLVSIQKYDKDDAKFDDIINLIQKINELGHNVIICKKPLFKENINWIRQRWTDLELVFPVGLDTINRILLTDLDEFNEYYNKFKIKNTKANLNAELIKYFEVLCNYVYSKTKFYVFKRKGYTENISINLFNSIVKRNDNYTDEKGISSTKIRNGELINKI